MKPDNIILEGVTGSTAYGLATENSDVDIKGVYHELGKFMKLVVNGNPTVTELLYLDDYTILSPIGGVLVDNRSLFLSTSAVMNAYRGYAFSQAKKLNNRTEQGLDGYASALKNRFAKHTRHCFRLLMQAEQLLTTGTLEVKVTPEQREYLFAMGEKTADEVVDEFMRQDARLEKVVSVLPDKPDLEKLNELLYDIRINNV